MVSDISARPPCGTGTAPRRNEGIPYLRRPSPANHYLGDFEAEKEGPGEPGPWPESAENLGYGSCSYPPPCQTSIERDDDQAHLEEKLAKTEVHMTVLQDLAQWQNKCGVQTKASLQSDVEELERRYAVALPDDFRAYLLNSCPVEEGSDSEATFWWSLARIRNIPDEYKHEVTDYQIAESQSQYLFFADYSIWCWAWAIACTDDGNRGRVAVIGGAPDRFVADSFSAFVQKYLSMPASVYPT